MLGFPSFIGTRRSPPTQETRGVDGPLPLHRPLNPFYPWQHASFRHASHSEKCCGCEVLSCSFTTASTSGNSRSLSVFKAACPCLIRLVHVLRRGYQAGRLLGSASASRIAFSLNSSPLRSHFKRSSRSNFCSSLILLMRAPPLWPGTDPLAPAERLRRPQPLDPKADVPEEWPHPAGCSKGLELGPAVPVDAARDRSPGGAKTPVRWGRRSRSQPPLIFRSRPLSKGGSPA